MHVHELYHPGFVYVPYPKKLYEAVSKAEKSWKKFCALPQNIKEKLKYSNYGAGSGYEFKDGNGPMSDIKENFDVALSEEGYLEGLLQRETDYNLIVRGFVTDALEVVEEMTPLVVDFSKELEDKFELRGFGKEIETSKESFFVRFIHYPPQKIKGETLAQAHADQSGMTLHLFESAGGFEGLTTDKFGNWFPLKISKRKTLIIPAMQLQLRSKGELRALWHRVVANGVTAKHGRFSAVSFIQFKETSKYNKEQFGRLQEMKPGFNYGMSHRRFSRLFK